AVVDVLVSSACPTMRCLAQGPQQRVRFVVRNKRGSGSLSRSRDSKSKSLRPWRRRSPLWFFLTARWLWRVLLSRGRWYSSSRRTSRLIDCARTSFSRTATLAGSSAARELAGVPQVRRGSLFSTALLV